MGKSSGEGTESPILSYVYPYFNPYFPTFTPYFNPYFLAGSKIQLLPHFHSLGLGVVGMERRNVRFARRRTETHVKSVHCMGAVARQST